MREPIWEKDEVDAAIARIEESKASHDQWAAHLTECTWCRSDKTTIRLVDSIEYQQRVSSEYEHVLEILRSVEEKS